MGANAEPLIIVLIILLVIIFVCRQDLVAKAAPAPAAPSAERTTSWKTTLERQDVPKPSPAPTSEVADDLGRMARDVKNGEFEIEDRAQLEQAEYHGYADMDDASAKDGQSINFDPSSDENERLAAHMVGPAPQDYTQAIKRIGLEPGVLENHARWVEDQRKFTNAYATKTAGRNHAINEFPEPIPWRGLRRPQAVPIYGVMADVPDTPMHRIKENKKFVFTF